MNFSKHSNAKGNIILGSEQTTSFAKNHSYCSLHNLNPNSEHVELDVSKVIGNTIATEGSIMMFYGNSVPQGWVLCDGSHGTPNLVDMFIEATTVSAKHKTTGGSNNISSPPTHAHTLSYAAVGNHSHTVVPNAKTSSSAGGHTHTEKRDKAAKTKSTDTRCDYWTNIAYTQAIASAGWTEDSWNALRTFHYEPSAPSSTELTAYENHHKHTAATGNHLVTTKDMGSHTVSLSQNGGTGKLNMPTYYSLVYIQKT